MDPTIEFLRSYGDYAWRVFSNLINPKSRIFFVFLITSALAAYILFRVRKPGGQFVRFLFPNSVWSNPSAWLDVRYFFFHALIGRFLLAGVGTFCFVLGAVLSVGSQADIGRAPTAPEFASFTTVLIAATAYILSIVVIDFVSFYLHYLQHKIPLLWQFHKVHHAGEVMHPLSNFREHPIDNLAYQSVVPFMNGVFTGLILRFLGYIPEPTTIFGLSIVFLGFNLLAYNLRHSHIWLRWPGVWSMILPSPAHHQVHHSRHPDHLDKNFAFLLPVWDVLFDTYVMPEDNRDIEFGIIEDASELDSCINLYVVPFKHAYRLLSRKKNKIDAGLNNAGPQN